MTRTYRVFIALVAGSALIGAGCTRDGKADVQEPMHLEIVEGRARVVHDSQTRVVDKEGSVSVGDRVLMSAGGIGRLTLTDGVAFELSDAQVTLDSGRKVTLDRGRILAVAEGPVAIDTDRARIVSDKGIFRVDRTLNIRVAVYEGQARIDGTGPVIDALKQAEVAAGEPDRTARYREIDPTDRWDLRYLKNAIDVDARLLSLSKGLEAQLGSRNGMEFFKQVLPMNFPVAKIRANAADSRTDVLVGSLIAYEATVDGGDREQVLADVFAMKQDRASWGLIAHKYGVAQSVLFALLLDSVNRAGIVDEGRGPALAAPKPTPSPTPTRPAPAQETPAPSEEPQQPAAPSQPSPPPNVLTPVADLLDTVVQDLLSSLLPRPTPKPNGGEPPPKGLLGLGGN
jgi:hypothetical protein